MRLRFALACLAAALPAVAHAVDDFRIEPVRSALATDPASLKPKTIAYSDQRLEAGAAPDAGLLRFDAWAQAHPLQKQFLGLFPTYGDVMLPGNAERAAMRAGERLYMYVVEARFPLNRPAAAIDLKRYANLAFLEQLDPAIRHKAIPAADVVTSKSEDYAFNRNPARAWCDGVATIICIESTYKLEGRLPAGIMIANKLSDTKKVADHLEFQSELRLLAPEEIANPDLVKLTGIDVPVAGAMEQSIFYVNQVIQYGKFIAILQQHPSDPGKSVATVLMGLGVKGSVFERKKEYENIPILRNLVPAQVLLGNSSFNTGASISAGLPAYTRNRIAAIASMLNSP